MVILCIVLTKYFTLCSKIESAFLPKSDVRPVGFFRNRLNFRQRPAAISTPVHVKSFDGEQVPQATEDDEDTVMEHSDNEYVEEEDEVTDDKGSEDGDSDDDDDDMDDHD